VDTRTKILTVEQTHEILRVSGRRIAVVTGYFDPVLADIAERLEEIRESKDALLAIVTEPPHPILPQRARAELLAGLAAVDYVVAPENGELLDADFTQAAIHEEAADTERLEALIRRAHARQYTDARD